jgi:threonine dehydratase
MLDEMVKAILTARVYEVADATPLDHATRLSARLENRVLLKREDQQQVFSFKLRGAHNRIFHLSPEERERGVIAASAGNHAQGVALAAGGMGIRSVIVMPKTTPGIKVDAVRRLGGEVVLHGIAYDDAYEHAREQAEQTGMVFIHPYDDPLVIAGQGTIAMEILQQHPETIDVIFVPVGGGGLIAGMCSYLKALRPAIKVIGVEPDDAPSLHAALAAGERVKLDQVGIFADGVAVRQVGELPFRLLKGVVDEVILASTDEICAAITDIFDDTRSIPEPAGALALAGLKLYVEREQVVGQTLIAIDSGANMNFDRLGYVAERADLGSQREGLLAVTIPERPGSFHAFCAAIGKRGITEFNYRFSDHDQAQVFAGVQLREGAQEWAGLLARLQDIGYQLVDLSDNEVAKAHARYMVGGHGGGLPDERLYRFEFPERPGALLRFLNHLGGRWNISLFHYRSHGAAFGRVLAGIQVPEEELLEFQVFLDGLGYAYWEESDNPAYRLFLS